MSLILMGRRRGASAAYEYLRPTVALPTGTSFNASTGRVEGDVYAPTFPTQTGTVHLVANESQFTTAIANWQRGDTIRLTADITITSARTLSNPVGGGWVVIEGDTLPSTVYGQGCVTAAEVSAMRKISVSFRSGTTPPLSIPAAPMARLWIRGVNFCTPATTTFIDQFLNIRNGTATTNSECPDEIVIDRCGFTGPPMGDVDRRAITLNTRRARVTGCRFTDIISTGSETKCIVSWEGGGPYQIDHNYMEGTGMSVLIGGAGMLVNEAAMVPADILVRRNHMIKPYRWNQFHPSYDAATYSRITGNSKNPFEAKVARRLCVTENVFEGAYQSAQVGTAVLLKQDGNGQTEQVLHDALVYLNQAINCNRVFGLSMDGSNQTGGSRGVHFIANVASNINAATLGNTPATPIYLFPPGETSPAVTTYNPTFTDVALKWLTVVGPSTRIAGVEVSEPGVHGARRRFDGVAITDSIIRTAASISPTNGQGFIGAGGWGGHGNPSIDANFVNTNIQRLAAVGAVCVLSNYPNAGTLTNISDQNNVGFVAYDTNLRLTGASPLIAAGEGGRPLGAPVDLIESVLSGVRQ